MPNRISTVLYQFASQLRQLLGDDLIKVILYGSYARGDFCPNSDVDLMILVKRKPEEVHLIENQIYDMAFDIELETGIDISPLIKSADQFNYWVDVLPFYRNVQNEGVFIPHKGYPKRYPLLYFR